MARFYEAEPLRHYVESHKLVGNAGWMAELRQPAGDYSSPPAPELLLVQPLSPGISLRKVWGSARFDGIVPSSSLWMVPVGTATDLIVRVPHAIRALTITTALLHETFVELGTAPDFAALSSGPFFDRTAEHWMTGLWHIQSQGMRPGRLHLDGMLQHLLAQLASLAGDAPKPAKGGLSPRVVARVTEAIAEAEGDALSLAELAAIANLSPFHFAKAFKASLGVSPHRFQKRLRLERAREMLAAGGSSVLEVALAVGYESGQALSRAFRQEFGTSPRAVRGGRRG
ncbi:AraC family transcriptional regulator [Elioraea rosea]|uniref:AraC family transcriptional regulator n=1 Tax=Elioraea rosea TaxID=2492390 RepID=UPI0013154845|nr:AraC family transcriptional regulator [Elioraea rosea]